MRIQDEPFRLLCPCFADELVGGEALEGLQSPGKVVGVDELAEVLLQLAVAVVVESSDSGVLDGSVHPLDLAVCPWMVDLGVSVVDCFETVWLSGDRRIWLIRV